MTLALEILVGLATFAAAIKSLPVIWQGLKSFYKFLIGMEQTTAIPELLENQRLIREAYKVSDEKLDMTLAAIATMSDELKAHMIEEENMRMAEKGLVEQLVSEVESLSRTVSHNSSKIANVVFRQAVFADSMAYYTMEYEDDGWKWIWGNKAYLDLTGITPEMAMSGHYWDIVKEEEKAWVIDYATKIGDASEPLDLDFTLVNMKTKKEHEVRVLAWPLHDNDGNAIVYLGAIEKKIDHVGYEKA